MDELSLDYNLARTSGDHRSRLNAIRAQAAIDPYTTSYILANTAMANGRPREALEAFAETDLDDPLWQQWQHFWWLLAQTHFEVGQYEEQLVAARTGRERFPENPLHPRHEGQALIGLGRLEDLEALLGEIEAYQPGPQNRNPGSVFHLLAADLIRFGYADRGSALAERALAWFEAQGPDTYTVPKAQALQLAGRPEEAVPLLRARVEEHPDTVAWRGQLGVVLATVGDTVGAEAEERWLRELDRPYLRGVHTYWQAAILAHLDRKDEAVRVLRQSFAEGRARIGRTIDPNLMPLWHHEAFERLVAPRG
jgi:tetratricopeptide (TPR) repeat protein